MLTDENLKQLLLPMPLGSNDPPAILPLDEDPLEFTNMCCLDSQPSTPAILLGFKWIDGVSDGQVISSLLN